MIRIEDSVEDGGGRRADVDAVTVAGWLNEARRNPTGQGLASAAEVTARTVRPATPEDLPCEDCRALPGEPCHIDCMSNWT